MSRIERVVLDIDGVMADFRRGICEIFHREPGPGWTFWESWEGVTTDDIDKKCTLPFWSNLHWTHDGREIEEAVRMKFGSASIYLLTTPMPNSGSWSGKARWVNKHLSLYNKRLIVTPAPKSLLAGPDTLLIDDKDENIAEFVAAGGQGILVPRPWNELHGWADETLQMVKNSLEDY